MLYWNIMKSGEIRFASSGHFKTQRRSLHPRRRLNCFVLLVGTSGECRIAQDDREYTLGAGDYLLLFPEHEHYGVEPTKGAQSHYWCHFWADGAVVSEQEGVAEYGHLCEPEKIDILFRQLTDAEYGYYAEDALRKRICDAYVSIILSEIAGAATGKEKEGGRLMVSAVKEWVKVHSSEPITPTDVAEQFGYHSDYLTSVFRRATGKTMCAYIREVRIRRAKTLLITTDMRIGQIAAAVGFADERYFMRAFRQAEGITPTKYRNAHFNLHENNE